MTKKLFWEDPYIKECKAKVIEIKGNEIKLEQTCFYAFSGGQASDSGTIDGINVIEARKEGKDIVYVLESAPSFKEGYEVEVKIDWEKRYKIMKLHAAAHIVFFIFLEKTKLEKLIGSNVDETKARLDYETPEPISSILLEVEAETNKLIEKDVDIKAYFEEGTIDKRLWECAGMECPCGGTHVKKTGEIGKIKLKRKNIGSGKERIEITLD